MARGIFVKFNAGGALVSCAASDEDCIGVTLAAVTSGDLVAIALLGLCNETVIGVASAAIPFGAKVYLTAAGKLQKAPASGSVICVGRALEAATVADEEIEIIHQAPVEETIS